MTDPSPRSAKLLNHLVRLDLIAHSFILKVPSTGMQNDDEGAGRI